MNEHLVNIHKALEFIAGELDKNRVNWFLGASAGLMVWGVDVVPNDVDIFVHPNDLKKLEKYFEKYVTDPLKTQGAERKYLGFKIEVFGIQVEIIGIDISDRKLKEVNFKGRKIPVNPLEKELEFYQKRSKGKEKIELIKKRIEELKT